MTSKNFFYFSEFFYFIRFPLKTCIFSSVCISRILFVSIVFDSGSTFVSLPSPPFVSSGFEKFFPSLDLSLFPDLFFLNYRFRFLYFFVFIVSLYFGISKLFPSRSYIPRQIPIIITDFSRNKRFYPIETQLSQNTFPEFFCS